MPDPDPAASDEELVTRVLSGDEDAALELFGRYFPRLRVRLRRRMSPGFRQRSAESDVIQEACIAAYLRLAEFEDRGPGSFARWLGGIADNKLLDEIRRHAGTEKRDVRRERAISTGARLAVASGEPSPSSAAMATERALALAKAIEAMPEQYRTIIHLLDEQRVSLEDAAARMKRSPGAVRMLYGRALAALGESLRRDGHAGTR